MGRIYLKTPIQNIVSVEKMVSILYFEYQKDYKSKGESHDFWEINYVDRGDLIVGYDGVDFDLSKGDLILMPPNRHHDLRADGKAPSSVFIISFDVESEFLNQLGCSVFHLTDELTETLHAVVRESRKAYNLPMENLPTQCLQINADALPGSQQLLRLHLETLLIGLIRVAINNTSQNVSLIPAKMQFDDNIADQMMKLLQSGIYSRLTLKDISKALGYGKTYLVSVFKKVYGVSVMAYYMQLKIDEAKRLIHDGAMTITEISEKLCFSTPQYFSKCFSQHVGMSPRAFKNSVNETWSTVKNI